MEAEAAFRQVLKMDPKCDDAVLELQRLNVLHLTVNLLRIVVAAIFNS